MGAGAGRSGNEAAAGMVEPRLLAAWRTWLGALVDDPEAALAAAFAYESLPDEARDAWLDALEHDAPPLGLPKTALYAPLLLVERSPERCVRIRSAIGDEPMGSGEVRALRGVAVDGTHVSAIVSPLYLHFVLTLVCRYTPRGGFVLVRHDPIRHRKDTFPLRTIDGVPVEPTPLAVVIDELAHAVLADRRAGRAVPDALVGFSHLFDSPQFGDGV